VRGPGQAVPGRAEAVRQRCDEEMAAQAQAQALRRALEALRASQADIKEALHRNVDPVQGYPPVGGEGTSMGGASL
jgi:hypothetical protein